MSGLRKPANCQCGSQKLRHSTGPERWTCTDCGAVVLTRQRSQKDIIKKPEPAASWRYDSNDEPKACTRCRKTREQTRIARTKRRGCVCLECFKEKERESKRRYKDNNKDKHRVKVSAAHKRWRNRNYAHLTKVRKRKAQETPQKFIKHCLRRTFKSVQQTPDRLLIQVDMSTWLPRSVLNWHKYQESPQRFIAEIWARRKGYIMKMIKNGKTRKGNDLIIRPKHDIDITSEYLIDLYNKQDGQCAVTGMQMTHEFKNPRSISIDRIDSAKGYVEGNVQLVCQWVNLAKAAHSDAEFRKVIDELIAIKTV